MSVSDETAAAMPTPPTEPDDDTGELPPLLAPGDLLAGRFRILSALRTTEGAVYRAEDLRRCPRCGAAVASAGESHCGVCGAPLDRRPLSTLRVIANAPGRLFHAPGAEVLDVQGFQVLVLPDEPARPDDLAALGLRLSAGTATSTGRVRPTNEDSLLAMNLSAFHEGRAEVCLGLFAIADGIGGLGGGAMASRTVVQQLAQHFGARGMLTELGRTDQAPEQLLTELTDAVQRANEYLHQQQAGHPIGMGSTLTAAYVRGRLAAIANVGDSRAYRLRGDRLEQLTFDHSLIAGLVRGGLVQPDEARSHPQKSVITRNVGGEPTIEVDTFLYDLAPGDRLVLVCDGVWEMLPDEDLAAILRAEPDPQRAATQLVARANEKGGEDNLSAIVVAIEEVTA